MPKGINNSHYERLAKVAQEQDGYEPFSEFEGEELKYLSDDLQRQAYDLDEEADQLEEAWQKQDWKEITLLWDGITPDGSEVREAIESKRRESDHLIEMNEALQQAWQNHDRETLKNLRFLS